MMNDVAKTPREELECEKKYLYEYSMFWECNDGSKCQILEDDVVRLLNEQQSPIDKLDQENADLLGARIKAQEEWEKCTDKLKAKILEQQATINKQDDEIKKLKRTERSWRKIHCCNKESNNCGIVIEQQNIISKLESDLQKIPPKIRGLWIGED